MSQYSLDSLENHSCEKTSIFTKLEKARDRGHDNLEDSRELVANDPSDLQRATLKSDEECCRTKEKAVATLGGRSRSRVVRNVPKKFDVPRRSSSTTSASASEFRLPCTRKSRDDVGGFMKVDKKLGNVQTATADKGKKSVSYLDLYRRKFASVERSRRFGAPAGSTLSICDDRSDERPANVENPATVSRDDQSELDFYRRVIELGSRGSRETRSCEALDRYATEEGVGKSTDAVSRCYSDSVQPVNRGRRVSYKPYSIEDYRSLSVPQPGRSLGPDRIEIESKINTDRLPVRPSSTNIFTQGRWLMRRRSYGDSVSARNRRRILHRQQKLKQSRRADAQKLPPSPLTDLQHRYPASKIVETEKRSEKVTRTGNSSGSRRRKNKLGRASKHREDASSGKKDLWENSDDALEDTINLRTLRQRHIEEKRKIDLLLTRGTRSVGNQFGGSEIERKKK